MNPKPRHFSACLIAATLAWAQGPDTLSSPQGSAALPTTNFKAGSFEEGREIYFKAMKDFIGRYAPTPASCTEIVEAALVGCDSIIDLVMARSEGWSNLTWQQRQELTSKFRENARRLGMFIALDAKYPNPEKYKEQPEPSATPSPKSFPSLKGGSGKK